MCYSDGADPRAPLAGARTPCPATAAGSPAARPRQGATARTLGAIVAYGRHRSAPAAARPPSPSLRRAPRSAHRPTSAAGRKRRPDQVVSIATWRTGRQPVPDSASHSLSRLMSVGTFEPPLG